MNKNNKYKLYRVLLFLSAFVLLGFAKTDVCAAKSYDSVKISAKDPVVVIRTSYATDQFEDGGLGGVYAAVPVKDTDCYVLYDVIIWEDRISLYKFDNNLDDKWSEYAQKNNVDSMTESQYLKAGLDFRESYLIKSVKCKNQEGDVEKDSRKRLSAYKAFFKIINKRSPSRHIVIKYSGHGGGSSFCGTLNLSDTKKIMKYGLKVFGQKFAIIDYGTNCVSGTTSVLNFYKSYTDYMIVSQLDFGGWEWDKWDYDIYRKVDSDEVYSKMFRKGETIRKVALRLGSQHKKMWPYGKKYMKKNKIPQSSTVVKMKEYTSLMKSLKKKAAARYHWDLYTMVKKYGGSSLLKKYKKAIIHYSNNQSYLRGKWTFGRGVNFEGFH